MPRLAFRIEFAKLRPVEIWGVHQKNHRHPLAALAGLALAFAFPNFNLAGAAWIAPALLLASAHGRAGIAACRYRLHGGTVFCVCFAFVVIGNPGHRFSIVGWVALSA
ncbi:MAG: hypothetical protein QM813_13275 [Verrucomicrobiota bacterium]